MGRFGALLWISHYSTLLLQLSAASRAGGVTGVENQISGNALFTEVPHDIVTQSGQDVEMACSFRGAGSSSVSLEIQWWYLRQHRERTEKPAWTTNQVVPVEEMTKDATKISVVKVAGSNISHRLRLSSVKPADEGTYECRVIDFSDSHAQHHRVRAYLQVQPPGSGKQLRKEDQQLHGVNSLDQLHSEEHNVHQGAYHMQRSQNQITERDDENNVDQEIYHGEHKLHHKEHHKINHGDPAHEGETKDQSGLHHGEYHQRDHQYFHEGDRHQAQQQGYHQVNEEDHNQAQKIEHQQVQEGNHHQAQERNHQVNRHTQASKKIQAKTQDLGIKAHQGHATKNSSDCARDDCAL